MKFKILEREYRVFWSYKKRRKGRVKTTCKIVEIILPSDQSELTPHEFIAFAQNNIDEGDKFLKKKGRKISFLSALEMLLHDIYGTIDKTNRLSYRTTKSDIFDQLKKTDQLRTII